MKISMIENYGIKHPKPVNPQVSRLIINYMAHIGKCHKPVLDIACGYGRNGFEFVKRGNRVVFIDYDDDCLEAINNAKIEFGKNSDCIRTLKMNLANGKLPFPDNSVSGVINIHYYNAALVDEMIRVLEPGGFFCFETIDGRISHELGLPEYGFLKYKLKDFDFLYYKENLVKGTSSGASVCKIVAIKTKAKNLHRLTKPEISRKKCEVIQQ